MTITEESSKETVERLYNTCAVGKLVRHVVTEADFNEYQELYRHDFLCMTYKCQTERQELEYQVQGGLLQAMI